MMINESNEEKRYDYIVVGAGAAGSVLAAELSASGAEVLVTESGGTDDAPTITEPSNVGGPLAVNAKQRILQSSELNDSGKALHSRRQCVTPFSASAFRSG